jgi:hypothetical protein
VLVPRDTDISFATSDERLRSADLPVVQAVILRQFNSRLKPELCLPIRTQCVDMYPRLFSGKEEEPEAVLTKNGWTQVRPDVLTGI